MNGKSSRMSSTTTSTPPSCDGNWYAGAAGGTAPSPTPHRPTRGQRRPPGAGPTARSRPTAPRRRGPGPTTPRRRAVDEPSTSRRRAVSTGAPGAPHAERNATAAGSPSSSRACARSSAARPTGSGANRSSRAPSAASWSARRRSRRNWTVIAHPRVWAAMEAHQRPGPTFETLRRVRHSAQGASTPSQRQQAVEQFRRCLHQRLAPSRLPRKSDGTRQVPAATRLAQ
ncbi:MAG: hypothetical protein ACI8PZ_000017 [Myxococcota bacterium]|jgi:hypothetical protein